jgi:hypothetical protein
MEVSQGYRKGTLAGRASGDVRPAREADVLAEADQSPSSSERMSP